MKTDPCPATVAHSPHEWYWRHILRRRCPGLVVEFCGRDDTHSPHRHGEYRDEFCRGLGLAGVCEHGEQMLNECKECDLQLDVVGQ